MVFASDLISDLHLAAGTKLHHAHLAIRDGFVSRELAGEFERLAIGFGHDLDAGDADRGRPVERSVFGRVDPVLVSNLDSRLAQGLVHRRDPGFQYALLSVHEDDYAIVYLAAGEEGEQEENQPGKSGLYSEHSGIVTENGEFGKTNQCYNFHKCH